MLVTLHLFGVTPARVPSAVARIGLDRAQLRRTAGLKFWKLLGTGDGRTFTVRDADPRRWGLLASWTDPAALAAFERSSPVAAAWRRIAQERWRADLVPLRSRGTWAGREPWVCEHSHGPKPRVAAITRARLRPALAATFWRAVPPVTQALHEAPGLRYAVGIGEAPIGLQGTFSLWDDLTALRAFAVGSAEHRDAVRRTTEVGWYAEELFTRFAVLQTTGTIDGVDPATA